MCSLCLTTFEAIIEIVCVSLKDKKLLTEKPKNMILLSFFFIIMIYYIVNNSLLSISLYIFAFIYNLHLSFSLFFSSIFPSHTSTHIFFFYRKSLSRLGMTKCFLWKKKFFIHPKMLPITQTPTSIMFIP